MYQPWVWVCQTSLRLSTSFSKLLKLAGCLQDRDHRPRRELPGSHWRKRAFPTGWLFQQLQFQPPSRDRVQQEAECPVHNRHREPCTKTGDLGSRGLPTLFLEGSIVLTRLLLQISAVLASIRSANCVFSSQSLVSYNCSSHVQHDKNSIMLSAIVDLRVTHLGKHVLAGRWTSHQKW